MTRQAEWIFVRVAWLLFALVALVTWLSFGTGCSVDSAGLSEPIAPLARGAVDTGVTEVVTPSIATPEPDSGASTIVPDAGIDVGKVGSDASDGGSVRPDSGDFDRPPSECPISATRSLSLCDATTQLCRYYDTGAPVLMTGCTAEGKLCVQKC